MGTIYDSYNNPDLNNKGSRTIKLSFFDCIRLSRRRNNSERIVPTTHIGT